MTTEPGSPGKPFRWAVGAALLGLLVIYQSVDATPGQPPVAAALAPMSPAGPAAQAPAPAAAPGAPTAPATKPKPATPALPRSRPTRLRVPQLLIDAPFAELGLTPAGALEAPAPDDKNLVGWYRDGATPGERGSAVVAGHVDTRTGPAVFLLLRLLTPGSTVEITREDGTVASFLVDSTQTFPKNAFPDAQVYADTPDAQLRLITCGGAYDKKAKDYTENVVVFAHLQSSRPA
ncbi:class F sortase [Kitasatospora sp. MMS16-BH015]|uniref:class F sortase n=1 Tax=Kitasatospora sp. MMS16-BH015 TaxID=2018025 RepID=UPI000CA354CB|nr:class F sortase [Kitasatospora sp. MMS16-BH015]AUG77118.1 class F sortase [Kitasatospora sp. MMS16-BH015]